MATQEFESKMADLSTSTKSHVAQAIDDVTADHNKIPGFVAVVVDKTGKTLLEHASGKRGVDTPEPVTLESVFWIASCTKMIVGIAAMQLVEQGALALDDPDLVEKLAPELKQVKILTGFDEKGKPQLVNKKKNITLRMLLSHTAGFGYSFFNEIIRRYGQPGGIDEFDGYASSLLNQPLVFEPGTDWSYGVGIDWAGALIERASGMKLNEYMQTHIFAPLNLHHITMFPTPQMRAQLVHLHQKAPHQDIHSRDHLLRRPFLPTSEHDSIFNSGGAGLFARPTDYAQIIATLLNDGAHPGTGSRILSQQSVDEMFTNQNKEFPDFGRKGIKSAKPTLSNDIPDLYPQPADQPQGWGLTFMLTIHEAATGRGKNSAWWAGLPNLFWWADREKGIGGIVATQILPFADPEVLGLWANIEKMIYDGLKS